MDLLALPKVRIVELLCTEVWVSVCDPVAAQRGQEGETEEETGVPYARSVVCGKNRGCVSGRQTPQDRNSVQSREGHWNSALRKQKRGSDCADNRADGEVAYHVRKALGGCDRVELFENLGFGERHFREFDTYTSE